MIWIVIAVIAMLLALVFVFALMRAASLADRQAERMFMTYSDEPRVRVTRGPYDHEARGDFD